MASSKITNIVLAGIGGQGVLKASDILSEAIFQAGYDIKKSEIHGMSQRGGSVTSDIRYGDKVFSPMVPVGEADFLLILNETQVDNNKHMLKPGGVMIAPDAIDMNLLKNKRSFNVALLGLLSTYLDIDEAIWQQAITTCLPEKVVDVNREAFALGRQTAANPGR
ncbi:MAG: indolepyruvate oxidoreductase subunit beta [bacterium]|jgi:indolepyruvate ferredoxin oxidoreductase beta subunit|nr:indolepyruvate oxidoreductase subunit beta [bacterium]